MAETANKRWPEARRAFTAAIKLNETDGEAWFDLAFVYIAEKDFANAETAFRKAIRYESVDSASSRNNLGVLLAIKGELDAAEREFETVLMETGGLLIEAKTNLEYCRTIRKTRQELRAAADFRYVGRNAAMISTQGE